MHSPTIRPHALLTLFTAAALAATATAQIPLSGSVADGAGGPLLTGVVYHASWFQVPAGQTLTVQPGAIVKGDWNTVIQVNGTLHCLGTAAQPVVFTSIHDDSAGGDTNLNGTSTVAAAGQWQGLQFTNSNASSLQHASIRYCGFGNQPSVSLRDSNIAISDCDITDGLHGGLCFTQGSSRPTVARCHFTRIDNEPCVFGSYFGSSGCEFGSLAGFQQNTAANCPGGAYIRVDVAAVSGNAVVDPGNLINGALVYAVFPYISAGATLTLNAGTVLKALGDRNFTVDGTLICHGTAAAPVVFTSIQDDSAGGDTNGDGNATSGAPGQWQGIQFNDNADATVLDHTTVRFTGSGQGNWAAVRLSNADVTLRDCVFGDAVDGGIEFIAGSRPIVQRCRFERIQGLPAVSGSNFGFSGSDFGAAANFTDNVAVNCNGNYMQIDVGDQVGNVVIGPHNGVNGVLVLGRWVRVPAGSTLTLQPGTVIKGRDYNAMMQIDGTMLGREVRFTSFHDDSAGGDTNGNGNATQPGPNGWGGVRFANTASGSLERCSVDFGGYAGPGIGCASAQVTLRACAVRHAGNHGFELSAAATAEDLVASDCASDGFRVLGGSFTLRRATSAFNTGYGIWAAPSTVNEVRSSIAWANGAAGFAGFGSGRLHYCCGTGIQGGTSNLNQDPQFVAGSSGDLRLAAGSPCIEAGDPLDAPRGVDAAGTPRLLDGDLDGAQRVDVGAHEFGNLSLTVTGVPAPGHTLAMALHSEPRIQLAVVVIGWPLPQPVPLLSLGSLLVDIGAPLALLNVTPQWQSPLALPAALPPMTVTVQAAGFTSALPIGNLSNAVTLRIE